MTGDSFISESVPEVVVTSPWLESNDSRIPSIYVTRLVLFTEDNPAEEWVDDRQEQTLSVEQDGEGEDGEREVGEEDVVSRMSLFPPPPNLQENIYNQKECRDKEVATQGKSTTCACLSKILRCIQDRLECPVCCRQSSGQIFQCEYGHVICTNCKDRLFHCPICRVKLRFPIRNLVLEQLAADIYNLCS